jgi:hypothetical protein
MSGWKPFPSHASPEKISAEPMPATMRSTGEAIKHGESHRVKAKKEEIEKAILLYNHVEDSYLLESERLF